MKEARAGHSPARLRNGRTGLGLNDIKTGFTSARRESGILNLTFHDLRHTWATRAAECGVPESVRRDILGHPRLR